MSAQHAAASAEPAPPHALARMPVARHARPAPPVAAPAAAPPPSQAVPLVAAAALLQPLRPGAAEGPHVAEPDDSAAPAAPASGEGAAAVPQALNGAAAWAALRGLQTACADGQDNNPYSLLCSLVARVGAAADTFGGMHSDLPEPERPDRGRLAEDLCDVLIQMLRLADACGADLGAKWDRRVAAYTARPAEPPAEPRAEPEAEESRPPKRARFSDVQRAALEALAERAQWALPSLSREEKEAFCEQHGMTKDRLQNFFNNHKPKSFRRARAPRGAGGAAAGSGSDGGAAAAPPAGGAAPAQSPGDDHAAGDDAAPAMNGGGGRAAAADAPSAAGGA